MLMMFMFYSIRLSMSHTLNACMIGRETSWFVNGMQYMWISNSSSGAVACSSLQEQRFNLTLSHAVHLGAHNMCPV